jgi:hypothetical protein
MINDQINVKISGQQVNKNTLAVLDIVANNFEYRPIYLGQTIPADFINLFKNHVKTIGLAYLITPEKLTYRNMYDIEKNYDLFINKFKYRGLNDPKIYWDETAHRMTYWYKQGFILLTAALLEHGDNERALKVLDKYDETFLPIHATGVSEHHFITLRYDAGDTVKANQKLEETVNVLCQELTYYARLDFKKQIAISADISKNITTLRDLAAIAMKCQNKELFEKVNGQFNEYKKIFPDIVKAYNII